MERAVALKKLQKLLGKKLAYRVNPKAANAEEREVAKRLLTGAIERRRMATEAKEKHIKALLQADAQYQALNAEYEAAKKHAQELQALVLCEKINVGTIEHGWFHVTTTGDSWEDVIEKVKAKAIKPA